MEGHPLMGLGKSFIYAVLVLSFAPIDSLQRSGLGFDGTPFPKDDAACYLRLVIEGSTLVQWETRGAETPILFEGSVISKKGEI